MSCADLILGLPAELSGEIVGRWLRVVEIARLDTAFCQKAARECLHRSIFTSSSCIITSVSSSTVQTLNWVALRSIRLEHVDVGRKNDVISVEYLQMYGKHIKSIYVRGTSPDVDASNILIARYCANLRSVEYFANYLSESFVELLNAYPGIKSLKIDNYGDSPRHLNAEPKINSLRVHTLDIGSRKAASERILSMCVPEAVCRFRISHERVSEWSRFTTLRSLDLQNCALAHHSLAGILDQCRSLVNLKVLTDGSFESKVGEHMPPLRSLNIENGYTDSESQLFSHGFVQQLKHTLEALYVCGCDSLPSDAINLVLAGCPHLRTLSIDMRHTADFTLMGSLTTLIMDVVEGDNAWGVIQQHCRSLQCLHVIFMYFDLLDLTPMIKALAEMPTLRALYFAGVTEEFKPACTEAAKSLRVLRPTLYVEENEAEWAWYDLFELPI